MFTQSVTFKNSAGITLAGDIEHPIGATLGWAIFAHCFTCSKQVHAAIRVSRGLAQRGIGVLRFDFTGLGESGGDFADTTFTSNVSDLKAAADWMTGEGKAPGLLVGHSLGGAASLVAAADIDCLKAIATIGAPSDTKHVIHNFADGIDEIDADGQANVLIGGRKLTIGRGLLDSLRETIVADAVNDLRLPLMILHSPTDETVGISNATDIFRAARHPKSFVSLAGADHFLHDEADAEFAAQVISAWAERYLCAGQEAGAQSRAGEDVVVRETLRAGPFQNEVMMGDFRQITDEPRSFGGSDTGPDPYDLLAAGLGGCTSMTLRMYADRKSWPLDRVTVRLRHEHTHAEDCESCGPEDKIDVFTREIDVEGALSDDQVDRLKDIADKCPVHRTLEAKSVIQTNIRHEKGGIGQG